MGLLLNRRRMMMGRGDEVIMTSASNPEVMAICYAQGWCASADKMTKTEAEAVTNIGSAFRQSNIVHFDELQYFGITDIPAYAFYNCAGLTSIVLPSAITSIGFYAFGRCTNVTCSELPSGLTSIGGYAFYQCTNISFSELPSGLTSIEQGTFYGCMRVTFSELPSGLTSIGLQAFQGCSNITFSELPSGLMSIGINAFSSCSGITISELPSGLTSIEQGVFYACHGITRMLIPQGVETLGAYVFANCYKLWDITCLAPTAPTVMDTTFTGTGTRASAKVLQVPSGASGYNESYWQTVLQDTNGFTLTYI